MLNFVINKLRSLNPPMLVCHCHALTDRDICRSIRSSGAESVAEVGDHCGAATGCGGCYEAVAEIVACERRRLAVLQESAKPMRDLPGLALTG